MVAGALPGVGGPRRWISVAGCLQMAAKGGVAVKARAGCGAVPAIQISILPKAGTGTECARSRTSALPRMAAASRAATASFGWKKRTWVSLINSPTWVPATFWKPASRIAAVVLLSSESGKFGGANTKIETAPSSVAAERIPSFLSRPGSVATGISGTSA